MSLNIKVKAKNYIEVYGSIGYFQIPNSPIIVYFFNTSANNKVKNSGPAELLRELKPMRERIDSSKLRDITSLLQRDLNDSRVAFELVPYLLGKNNDKIAFFPAILAALMPMNFLINEKIVYPIPSEEVGEGVKIINYNDNWILERILDNKGGETSLGLLKIDPHDTEIIVLDGQHRANAFRIVTDTFNSPENSIYEPFYEGITINKKFDSDLPVTIIWFESSGEVVDPKLISRKLFVDVNNTARPVSESRTILLSDNNPSAVLTRMLYSKIAQDESFNPKRFSLLHSGFDIDSDLSKSSPNALTISTPEIVFFINEWIFFGTRVNNSLDRYEIKRYPSQLTDTSICARLLPIFRKSVSFSEDDTASYKKIFNRPQDYTQIQNEFDGIVYRIYNELYNNFNFLKLHFNACDEINQSRNNKWASSIKKEIWDKVFCGGEGLYYSIKNIPAGKIKASRRLADLISTIEEIEIDFEKIRFSYFKDLEEKRVNDAYKSFKTKAFQVGFIMAFVDYMNYKFNNFSQESLLLGLKGFLGKLNNISNEGWVYILTDLRSELIKGTDPKKWPAYHKVVLRIIQDKDELFSQNANVKFSPEVRIFEKQLKLKYNSWLETFSKEKEEVILSDIEPLIEGWNESSKIYVNDLFKRCNIEIMSLDWLTLSSEYFHQIFQNKLNTFDEGDEN